MRKIAETSTDLLSIKEKLKLPFEAHKGDELYNPDVDLSSEKLLSYSIRIDGFEFDSLVDSYARSLEDSISDSIRDLIIKNSTSKNILINDDFKLDESIINKLKILDPSFVSESNYLIYDRNYKNDFPNLIISKSRVLPNNFFGKSNSVSFNIEFDNEKSLVRYLTKEEIENIIEKEYSMTNGLYKFSEYENDEIRSVLVTKDELIQYISKKIIFAQLVFKVKVSLMDGEYLIIRRKKDEDE